MQPMDKEEQSQQFHEGALLKRDHLRIYLSNRIAPWGFLAFLAWGVLDEDSFFGGAEMQLAVWIVGLIVLFWGLRAFVRFRRKWKLANS